MKYSFPPPVAFAAPAFAEPVPEPERTDLLTCHYPSRINDFPQLRFMGSKQTDVLGDINRIIQEKRDDTHLIIVTDGIPWKERLNDLKKLIILQNQSKILRIYTQSMATSLAADLKQLKEEHLI